MPRTTPSRLLIAAVLAVLLHGCATTPTPGPPTPAPSPALTEAARLAGDGRMDAAAARLEQAAGEASSPARANALRLQAAILYARAGDDATASTLRDDVGDADAGEAGAGLRLLLRMRLDGETLAPATVIRRLTPVPDGLAPPVAAAWLDQRAEARRAGGEPLAAARDLIRAQVLSGRTDGARSERIWSILQQIPPDRLEQAAGRADSGAEAGWLSLANRVRDAGDDTDAVASAVSSWHSLYPDHPASDFADQLVERRRAALAPPKRIALLLPLSGDLAEVGKAIRDGFLTAYYAAGDERPALDILDTKGSVAGAVAAYQHAGNADMVVGPLTKAGVRAVSSRRNDDRQVLTLNTVDGESSPEGVYHFGLSPEDDARTAARAAWASGKDRAVVLVPTGEWGSRVAGAYTEAFEDLGGKILETARYPEDESDYSTTLRQLFNLDVSERRYRELRRLLRRDIEFSPRRRQDMQAVFIGAFPRQARLIMPQIRFHHGLGLAVYATSHAYPRTADDAVRQDLEGLRLVELPWLLGTLDDPSLMALHTSAVDQWSQSMDALPGLLAFGVDAYRAIGLVRGSARASGLPGATGTLTIDDAGIVHRTPTPVRVAAGGLRPTARENIQRRPGPLDPLPPLPGLAPASGDGQAPAVWTTPAPRQ